MSKYNSWLSYGSWLDVCGGMGGWKWYGCHKHLQANLTNHRMAIDLIAGICDPPLCHFHACTITYKQLLAEPHPAYLAWKIKIEAEVVSFLIEYHLALEQHTSLIFC